MSLFVAVDGGNSKTDVVLGDSTGRVLAYLRGPGSSPHLLGVPASVRLIGWLVTAARATAAARATGAAPPPSPAQGGHGGSPAGPPAGPPDGSPAGPPALDRVDIFLAGADLPVEVDTLMVAVGQAGWAHAHRVENDTFALLRAGTDARDAVAVVCGAGINGVGRAADGRTARFLSLGQISGDWGGGHHLATLVLYHAARGEDGRGPATALSSAVAEHCGRSTVEEVSAGLHLGEIRRERLHGLSRTLFTVAAQGDAVARRLVARQAEEVTALATVAAGRLGLLDRGYAVVLGGGVLRARHPLLDEAIRVGIAARSPHAEITVLDQPPVVGAALSALDALGAPPSAGTALRAALRAAGRPTTVTPPPAA